MKCEYCDKEMDANDPNYAKSNIHYDCATKLFFKILYQKVT